MTIGAHWYNRPQSLGVCAFNFLHFLLRLREADDANFSTWYLKGNCRKNALEKSVDLTFDSILKTISKKESFLSYPSISFSTGFWNGKDNDSCTSSVTVSLGSDEEKYFTNNCVLRVPNIKHCASSALNKEKQDAIVNLLFEIWKPEWVQIDGAKIYNPTIN